jgi:hypothetical protein
MHRLTPPALAFLYCAELRISICFFSDVQSKKTDQMSDVFLSYSAKDRERVRYLRDGLALLGFQVFWDQEVPPGREWNDWIVEQLRQSRSVIVVWSSHSVVSRNVRHEVDIAVEQGKLLPVLLEPLGVSQMPMGHSALQAVRLVDWTGNAADPEWQKLVVALEAALTTPWMRRRFVERDTSLRAEVIATKRALEAAQAEKQEVDQSLRTEIEGRRSLAAERDMARAEASRVAADQAEAQRVQLEARAEAAERKLTGHPVRTRRALALLLPIGLILCAAFFGTGYFAGRSSPIGPVAAPADGVSAFRPNELYAIGLALIKGSSQQA